MCKSSFKDYTPAEWIEMWNGSKRSTVASMYRNLTADIEAGYDLFGYSVRQAQAAITTYVAEWERQITELARLDTVSKGRKCFEWLKKSGDIE